MQTALNKLSFVALIPLIALASCVSTVDHSKEYKELGEARGYACGFVAGQNATLVQLGSQHHAETIDCDDEKASAVKHGFNPDNLR